MRTQSIFPDRTRGGYLLPPLILGFLILAQALWAQNPADFFIFQPLAARPTARDWTQQGASAGLNKALQSYETSPSMTTAIGVLQYFKEFKGNPTMRTTVLRLDPELFTSIDMAKYEIVMHVRKNLPNVKKSRRVGSSGKRELAYIKWVTEEKRAKDKMPTLDPEKQFYSDDDITNFTESKELLADEKVNGSAAEEMFRRVTHGYGNQLDPKTVEVEFLSPTTAWSVFQKKYGSSIPKPPDYLLAWTAANPEKYNDPFGVYMLEVWGYEKGVATEDVAHPMSSTKEFKEIYEAPKAPPEGGMFGYIANNYRQIYDVHKGDFKSQCKYLVRMIDAWIAVHKGPEALPQGWAEARARADLIYKLGTDIPAAGEFSPQIREIISNVVKTTHEYHLDRVTQELQKAMETLKPKTENEISISLLAKANPKLLEEMDGLLVAYSNVPEDVHKQLMEQFANRIKQGEASSKEPGIYASDVLKYIMEVVQKESTLTRGDILAFRRLNEEVGTKLKEHFGKADLDKFVNEVALGKSERSELRLVDGMIQRVQRQLSPQDVLREAKVIQTISKICQWDNQKEARIISEYFDSNDPGMGVRMLRSLYEVFDTSKARPITVQYKNEEGTTVTQEISSSGTSLGGAFFKGAVKGATAWGQMQSGKDLFERFSKLYQGGMNQQELGEAYATILASSINLYDLFKSEKMRSIPMQGVIGSVALGSLGGIGAGPASPEAASSFAYTLFKDVASIYMAPVAEAIMLWELGEWAYKEYSLSSNKNDVIEAMLENGVWQPADVVQMKKLKAGELPQLKAIRARVGAAEAPKEFLARLGFQIRLIESQTELDPRASLIKIAHDGGYIEGDPVIGASLDAIKNVAGPWLQHFRMGALPTNPSDWTVDAMRELGILIGRREDEISPISANAVSVEPGLRGSWASFFVGKANLTDTQLRIIGYLMSDYWVKRQLIMEKMILPALEKEAARLKLDKLKELDTITGNLDFMLEVGKIDQGVAEIDKKLWPRIAHSADPFPGPEYLPDTDTPILKSFQESTRQHRTKLQTLESFLKDSTKTTLAYFDGGATRSIDKKAAEHEGTSILKSLRDYYYKFDEGYEEVHNLLDQANRRVKEGGVLIEPFHVKFEPGALALLALGEGLTPVRGDIKIARDLLAEYKAERETIAKDIGIRKQQGQPVPKSFLEWLYQGVDTSHSPDHPLWPDLTRLRYQIRKIKNMQQFVAELTKEEIKEVLGHMSIKAGEPLKDLDVVPWDKPAEPLAMYINLMEEEYRRLLDSLGNLFEMTLKIDASKPYIGQEIMVTATPKFKDGLAKPTLGESGFPDYVSKFRWTVKNTQADAIGQGAETQKPEWKTKFAKAAFYNLELQAVDKGGNALSTASIGASAQPISLSGSIGALEGDYDGEPISVTAAGASRGEVSKMGDFSFGLDTFDEDAWKQGGTAFAAVTIENKTYGSSASAVEFNPEAGVLKAKNVLQFKLPYNVSLKVEVTDRAKLDVPLAEVTILVAGAEKAEGRSAVVKLEPGGQVGARAEFAQLGMTQDVPAAIFDPKSGRDLTLKVELPMLDVGHLTVTGQLVPPAATTNPPQLVSGEVASNVNPSAAVASQGVFTFTNSLPVDMRSSPMFEARAVVLDANKQLYRPKAEPFTRPIVDKRLDLGQIEVGRKDILIKPIMAQLFDITGRALPQSEGRVLIANVAAPNQNGTFAGEYTFTDLTAEIVIEGGYALPGGAMSVVQEKLSLQQLGGWQDPQPPPMYNLRLPFYLPGSLHVTGRTSVEGVAEGQAPPERVNFEDGKHGVSSVQSANNSFDFVLPVSVQLGEDIALTAVAQSGDATYHGSGSTVAPSQPGPADVGEIILSSDGSGRPGGGGRRTELLTSIQAQLNACNFEGAYATALQLQEASPADPWLSGNLDLLQELASVQRNVRSQIEAAQGGGSDKQAEAMLIALRQSVNNLAPCLAAQIEPVIRRLERQNAQTPSWLPTPKPPNSGEDTQGGNRAPPGWLANGAGGPGSRTNPDDAINKAREILTKVEDDQIKHRQEEQGLQTQTGPAKLPGMEEEPPTQANNSGRNTSPPAKNKSGGGGKEKWNALANLVNGISTAIINSSIPLGGSRLPIPSIPTGPGKPSSERDPFEGIWEGSATLTAHRAGSLLGGQRSMVALFSPQKDLSVRIVKSGNGYILQAPGGAQSRNQYVRGNKIGFVGNDSMEIPDRITFTITFDLEVNGDRMTGSLRAEGSDGTFAARSVNCARQ